MDVVNLSLSTEPHTDPPRCKAHLFVQCCRVHAYLHDFKKAFQSSLKVLHDLSGTIDKTLTDVCMLMNFLLLKQIQICAPHDHDTLPVKQD